MVIVDGAIGCDEKSAIKFVGCSANLFAEYKARRIIKPLRRGWYCYEDLVEAVNQIRKAQTAVLYLNHEKTEGELGPEEEEVGRKGSQRRRKTQDILGQLAERGGG